MCGFRLLATLGYDGLPEYRVGMTLFTVGVRSGQSGLSSSRR